MKFTSSRFLPIALFALAAGAATAQDYPVRPVRFVVGAAAGSAGDVVGRMLSDNLGSIWKQTGVIENRPGAGGIIGGKAVLGAPPDGYTLFVSAGSYLVIAPSTTANMPYDVEKDFTAVAFLAEIPLLIGVNPKLPIRNLQELIAYAKANPGKINYSANTPGTFPNLASELFAQRAGIQLTFVPYNGALAAMQDIMGDRLQMAVEGVSAFTGAVKSGQLRPVAVTSATRVASLPDIPAAGEIVPGYAAVGFYALMAHSKVPDSIVRKINADVRQVLARPEVSARFAELGNYVKLMSPEETTAFIRKERTTWEAVIKQLGFAPR